MAQAAKLRALALDKAESRKKPEKERKPSSGHGRKKGKKRTVTMHFQGQDDAKSLPAASWDKVGSLCASVQEALDRFYSASGFIPEHEIKRMRICFQRFSSEDNDLYRGQVHEVLTHLCYVPVSEDKATAIAKDTNEFSTLDFQDFCDFVERYTQYEREVVRVKLEEWTAREKEEDDEADAIAEVRGFLKSLGIICLKDTAQEVIELGGMSGRTCSRPEELLRCLSAYRALEGFTKAEIDRIHAIFLTLEAEPQPKTAADMRSERHIKASQLCDGLLKIAGLYCADHLRELLDKMEETIEGEKITPFLFYEFLVCARRLRDAMLTAGAEEFDNLDADEDGIVEANELRELCKPLGFTLSAAEWDELVEELNLGDEDVEFQDAWDFLQSVQAKNGFTASEQQELIEAFGRFSTVSGELENLKVKDLLTYLGFETTVDDVQDMVSRVDFNGSKTMDQNEFLRLMRLQREITIASYTAAYSRNRLFAHGGAPPEEIERVLALAKLHPNVHIMAQALEVVEESGDYDHSTQSLQFEGFLKVADYCRKTIPVYNRRHAHFQLNQIDELRKSFNSQDMESKGFISIGSFLGLLADTTLAVNTVAGRARMYEQLERAREAALEAGVNKEEVGNPNSPRVRFLPMVHFVHETVKNHEDAVFEREDAALKEVTFSKEEVQQFRDLFAQLVKQHEAEVAASAAARERPAGRRLSAVQAAQVLAEAEEALREQQQKELTLGSAIKRLTKVDRVPAADIIKMVSLMGIQATGPIRQQLFERCMHFSDKPEQGVDFPGFLQLMQWMVGTNFGNILAAAEQTVKSEGLRSDASRASMAAGVIGQSSKFGHMDVVNVRSRKYLG
ncbi:CML13 [Symbiodinium natans]|uniref:Calmodulin n=1 Tax=Symbiodinium natans TaxID=878477 RepID=A0A812M1A5_9DINO|nr:CML13 [Symbiodinium natans]